jgi:dipeptidyl aminopeptidase/acylaminoacyl peptidase
VMKVADWLFARPYVDRGRVGVTGGSYGGYMTNWIVAHSDRFRAAVTQRSVVNLESMFGTSDFGYSLGYEFGGTPWKNVDELRRQSPITYVTNIRTPLLIEHEEDDLRCPIEQAEQLFTALRVLGREVEFVRFEGESHGLSRGGRPLNRAERLRRIIGWFDRWMPEGRK